MNRTTEKRAQEKREHAWKRHETKLVLATKFDGWTAPVTPGPLHRMTAAYLGLNAGLYLATAIDYDGYREEYLTHTPLYRLVEELALRLQQAATNQERDALLDKHLDALDRMAPQFRDL